MRVQINAVIIWRFFFSSLEGAGSNRVFFFFPVAHSSQRARTAEKRSVGPNMAKISPLFSHTENNPANPKERKNREEKHNWLFFLRFTAGIYTTRCIHINMLLRLVRKPLVYIAAFN